MKWSLMAKINVGVESVTSLHNRLARCKYHEGEEVFEWLAKMAGIYTQLRTAGVPVPDLEMKHRAMSLIAEAQTWGAMAHLLGTGDHVSYREWQAAMLQKAEVFEQNGVMPGQTLADNLYGRRNEHKGAFQATGLQQTFRGSGFANRKGGFGRHRGSVTIERGRAMGILSQRGFIP